LSDGWLHLGEKIGSGFGSEVFVAWLERSQKLLKRVAVKLFGKGSSFAERIESVARAMALVRHPNVVEILDYGVLESGVPFVVMEMIDGMSLASLLRVYRSAGRRLPLDLALFVAIEAAEGLAGVRMTRMPGGKLMDVSHLDLSARSILLSFHGEVKVEGFGLAAPIADGSGIRVMRRLAPRLETMAPEIAAGRKGDSRSDVFSLGVILHEMLVGPRFPAGITDEEACAMAKSGFVCPDLIAGPLPNGVQAIVDRALSKDPRDRQAHTGVLAYDLRTVALKMGVGDARVFLRNALFEMSEAVAAPTET
jgi:serine/threonine-protein kinase